jgi:hypothetical protein
MHPNDDPYKNIVAQVALHLTQKAAFDGILPCEPGYAAAVFKVEPSISTEQWPETCSPFPSRFW